ncbi:MAG: hypothetical protein JWM23_255 [Microbacteriaceae bacterium]|nr:hypothetical protein [Microbacteriaceae bacterium]
MLATGYAVLVMGVSVSLFLVLGAGYALSQGASWGQVWASAGTSAVELFAGSAAGASALLLLVIVKRPSRRWGFAWRGAVAGYVCAGTAPLMRLIIGEWLSGQPGDMGGFAIAALSLVAFTLLGGPIWVAIVAVLLRRAAGAFASSEAPLASAEARSSAGGVFLTAGTVVALGVVLLSYVPAMYHGADYKCLVEGPFSAQAEISERPGIATGRFSFWPLGRECEWARADGRGTVVVNSGNWSATGIAAAASCLAVVGAGLLAGGRDGPRGRNGRRPQADAGRLSSNHTGDGAT